MKKKRETTQTTKFRNERGSVTINLTERKRTVKGCYEQLHANKLDKLDKMDKLLKRHKQQTLAEEEIENP